MLENASLDNPKNNADSEPKNETVEVGSIEYPDGSVLEVTRSEDNNLHLIIRSENGESVDLSNLCEKRCTFLESEHFQFRFSGWQRLVGVRSADLLNQHQSIFALLHEIGHIVAIEKRGGARSEYFDEMYENNLKPADDLGRIKSKIKTERDAWVEALTIARKMREKGIDLFTTFDSNDDLIGWIRAVGLRTYEHDSESQGEVAYTKDNCVAAFTDSVHSGRYQLSEQEVEAIRVWSKNN